MESPKTIFIVGGAGYVGEMLCDQFSKRTDVERVIALDKEPQSAFLKNLSKVTYIEMNMADSGWEEQVARYSPEVVIDTAWQIRELYGKRNEQWRWNVEGSKNVFTFAFRTPSVKKLIYFSTASSYGAQKDNTLDHFYTEAEGFRDDEYSYAHEKKVVEGLLYETYTNAKEKGGSTPQVFVVRPAAITGPRGRHMRMRFGLQSALQGNLKGDFVYTIVTGLTAFVPATKGWVRQFIHEDDVSDIITMFAFEALEGNYEVFNITPPGEPVLAGDMAEAVGKRVLSIQPWMVRIAFWFFWHLTRGKVPTCPGSWRFYSYPVLMDGSKLTKQYGYVYRCSSKDAFRFTNGRYEAYIQNDARHSKPTP